MIGADILCSGCPLPDLRAPQILKDGLVTIRRRTEDDFPFVDNWQKQFDREVLVRGLPRTGVVIPAPHAAYPLFRIGKRRWPRRHLYNGHDGERQG